MHLSLILIWLVSLLLNFIYIGRNEQCPGEGIYIEKVKDLDSWIRKLVQVDSRSMHTLYVNQGENKISGQGLKLNNKLDN